MTVCRLMQSLSGFGVNRNMNCLFEEVLLLD